ncbi:MAG: hypothetical protein KGO50_02515 [Myxococcales bacterium]|nr:hypothetical protein [Myxococcales bacterium]
MSRTHAPYRQSHSVASIVRYIALFATALAGPQPLWALEPEDLEPVWMALSEHTTERFINGEPASVPWSSFQEWRRLRREQNLGDWPLYLADVHTDDLATTLQTLHTQGYLELERALLVAAVQGGVSDPASAWVWDTALADFAAHVDSDAAAWLLHARATQLGSTAALLPVSCFPQTPEARRALESMIAAETSARMARPRNRVETEVAFTEARARLVLPHLMEPAVWASLTALRESLTSTDATGLLPSPDAWPTEPGSCDPRTVASIMRLDVAEPELFASQGWVLQSLAQLHRVGPLMVTRFVVGRYLRGDLTGLRALAAIEANAGRHELWPAQAIASLLASAAQQGEQALALSESFVDARDPFRLWVRAEALRAAERFAEARDTATQAIDRDPGFGAALITRAASWVGLGFPQEANADLVFLETAWATLPGYDVLIERLARVVR